MSRAAASCPRAPRAPLRLLLATAVAVLTLSLSLSGAAASPYDSPGPYTVVQARVAVAASTASLGGDSAVPDLGGEEGELVVYHPAGTAPGRALLHYFTARFPFQLNCPPLLTL